jgi:hypothetical protein
MYPSGGYGNFLYHLLTEYIDNTVKVNNKSFQFSATGNSHSTYKYTESFLLGKNYKNLQDFSYNYQVNDQDSYEQVLQGKKFLVLGDTGNLVDSVKFLRTYFPQATFVRTYANSFKEKLVVWANTMTKTNIDVYKDSLHTIEGIAKFSNKSTVDITDQDAIDCLVNFFKNDFDKFGKFYSTPKEEGINVPIQSFFNYHSLISELSNIATRINGQLIHQDKLKITIEQFIDNQSSFKLSPNDNTITGKALAQIL